MFNTVFNVFHEVHSVIQQCAVLHALFLCKFMKYLRVLSSSPCSPAVAVTQSPKMMTGAREGLVSSPDTMLS